MNGKLCSRCICVFLGLIYCSVGFGDEPTGAYAQTNPALQNRYILDLSTGYEYGPTFRGTDPTKSTDCFLFDASYSWLGWSAGIFECLSPDGSSSQTELVGSYSYPIRYVDLTG